MGAWAAAHLGDEGTWRRPLRYLVARDEAGTAMGVLPLANLRVARQTLAAVAGFYQPYRTLPVSAADIRDTGAAIADALHGTTDVPALRIAGGEEPDETLIALVRGLHERGWAVYEETKGYVYCVPLPPEPLAVRSGAVQERARERQALRQEDAQGVHRRGARLQRLRRGRVGRAVADLGTIETRSWLAKDEHGDMRFAGDANARFWDDAPRRPGVQPRRQRLRPLLRRQAGPASSSRSTAARRASCSPTSTTRKSAPTTPA